MKKTPDDSAPSGRSARRRTRKRRRALTRALVAVGVLVLLIGSVVGGGALLLHNVVGQNLTTLPDAEAFPEGDRPASADGDTNILLIGSDSRGEGGDGDIESGGGGRSDVLMLMHIPADRSSVSVMSIMRDLWLPVPGHGEAKVNAALAWGGTPLTIQTVEGFLGARIDHVALIDFEGISEMTAALGGVYVDNPAAFTAKDGDFFAGGPIELRGPRALAFVRERYAFGAGDYQRVENQQLLLKGILDRAISRDVLGDPRQLVDFATETSKNVTVDAGFTLSAMGSLAYSLRGIDSRDIDFFTIPTAGTGTSSDGQSIVRVDAQATERLRQALRDDTVAEFAESLAAG